MYRIRIDTKACGAKPSQNEIPKISNRLSNTAAACVEWNEFCDLIGNKGHSFCVCDFSGSIRKAEFFKSQQIFALDFDGGITFEEIISRTNQYDLPVALAYETFSSENLNKFRIVFLCDTVIQDIRIAEYVIDILITLFPEADSHCKDVSRIFFGGKRLLICNEVTFNIENLLMTFSAALKNKYGETHYKDRLESFAKKHKLKRRSGFIAVDNSETSFVDEPVNIKAKTEKIRNFNFNILCDKCRLFKEFSEGTAWLYHRELFGTASNLNCIERGRKQFLNILESTQNEEYLSYREKDWRFYLSYMTAQEYKPMLCENFCRYADECNHASNMILTAKTAMNTVVKLKEKDYCTLQEAEDDLSVKLTEAVNSNIQGINIIKAQTAIGKTHKYIDIIKNSDKKFIVAVPTNILKDEVYNRMIMSGITSVVKTHSITEIEQRPDEVGETIKKLNSFGTYRDVKRYIKELAAKEEYEYLLKYIQPVECYDDSRVIVTTHKKFLNARKDFLENYEIIIDEDILLSSAKNTVSVLIEDLERISEFYKVRYVLKNLKEGEYIKADMESTYIDFATISERNISTNVNTFMKASALCRDNKYIHCFMPVELQHVKCTIVSATADEDIYRMCFPDRHIHFEVCKKAKYTGHLIQDCSRSYSRRDIEQDDDLIERIIEENPGFKYVISFMRYKHICNDCKIHFGNTEGCDYMKGENLLIIGTPHMNEFIYKLLAVHIGISADAKMRHREVSNEGYKFWFNTYDNENLRKIQLWFIQSELEQAVGRARLLRFDCTVKLFANLPLEQAEFAEKN